mmetsp:Transcript_41082/g.87499  ORF Transcript_41082/g.87499 Transcript_41082/m.87499 type:complete len:288 (+) Transcript_41082:104-967(+)
MSHRRVRGLVWLTVCSSCLLTASSDALTPLVYHFHIPKTGGMSFKRDLWNMIPAGRHRLYSKNECYSWGREVVGTADVITMMRNPRSQLSSMYRHCIDPDRRRKFNSTQVPVPIRNFRAYLKTWEQLDKRGWKERLNGHNFGRIRNVPFRCFRPVNMVSHLFTCSSPWQWHAKVDMDLATRNLHSSFFVGLTEMYQESLCLLYAKLHGALPIKCDCENSTAWSAFSTHQIHQGYKSKASKRAQYPPEIIDIMDRFTATDVELYNIAKDRFMSEVKAVELKFKRKIIC